MTISKYRLLRYKAARLVPRTMLGRLALYVLLLRFGVYVLQELLRLAGKAGVAESLDPWGTVFSFVLGTLLLVLGLRWVRNEMMWRLRNRLIVTYVFIGVIPVLLILGMTGLSALLFSNQYVTSQALLDIEAQIRNLDLVNASLSSSLDHAAGKSGVLGLIGDTRVLEENFPDLQITVWKDGKLIERKGKTERSDVSDLPKWVQDGFHGIVVDKGQHFLRAVHLKRSAGKEFLIIFSVPLSKAFMDKAISGIGQVKFYTFVPAANTGKKSAMVITQDDTEKAGGQRQQMEVNKTASVSGGKIPTDPKWFWDPVMTFGTAAPYKDWESGNEVVDLMQVATRPSAIMDRLFSSRGQYARAVLVVMGVVAVVFAVIVLIAIIFGIGLTRTVTNSVYNLYQATQEINRGNLKHRIPVKNKDQLAALQTSFNSMAENLEKLLAEQKEKERLENELAIAQEVQSTLFPREAAQIKALEVHGICKPARTVSGDYYDFIPSGRDQLCIALGDISGKGISAALLMATVHSAVRAFEFGRMPARQELVHTGAMANSAGPQASAQSENTVAGGMQSPSVVLELLNRHLYRSTQTEKYATMFLSVYDGRSRTLTYSNAGHLPPIIVGEDGTVRRLEIGGTVIGLFDEMTYQEGNVQLRPNDIFVAFSDGVTEPENEFGEFGEERLLEIILANRNLPLARLSELVTTAVQDWIGSAAEQPDDITLVLARAV